MLTKISFLYISLLILGLQVLSLQARENEQLIPLVKFNSPANENLLSNVTINDIQQDNQGFMWIATADGLNRFDGNSNVVYRPKKDKQNSLSHYNIRKLLFDSNNNFLVATEKGLNIYDRKLDAFKPFQPESIGVNLNIQYIDFVFEDSKKRLWITTRTGYLILLNQARNQSTILRYKYSSKEFYVRQIIESSDGQILLASNLGLISYNEQNKLLEPYRKETEGTQVNLKQLYLYNDTLFLGAFKGLYSFNLISKNKKSVKYDILNGKNISTFNQFSNTELLIGTRTSGLYLLNLETNQLKEYKSKAHNYSIKDNQVYSTFKDYANNIWIGTNAGISIISSRTNLFNHYKSNEKNSRCLKGNSIYATLKDSRDNLWIGSFGEGITKIDVETKKCLKLPEIKSRIIKDLKNTVYFFEDNIGNIWIGTYSKGVYLLSTKEQQIKKVNIEPEIKNKPSNYYVTAIDGDSQGNIFIATRLSGLIKFNASQNKSVNITPTSKDLNIEIRSVKDIHVDRNDNLWVATSKNGLWKASNYSNSGNLNYKKIDSEIIPNTITSLDYDSLDNLWIGTAGKGIIKYHTISERTSSYSTENGLLSNVVMKALEDKENDIWLMTDKGVSRVSIKNNGIQTFIESDGLQANAFTNTGIYDKNRDLIFTGGVNGISWFHPSKVSSSAISKKVVLTKFELFYKLINISNNKTPTPLKGAINQVKEINLNYDQNIFSFSFSALEYIKPKDINYAFKLEGYDKDWNYIDSGRHHANFTNINPGRYVFRVRATNIDGKWNEHTTSIKINIAYPWWQTNLAYTSYLIILVLLVYFITSIRTKTLIKRAQQLEHSVNQRTAELAQEKSKVEQLLSRKNEEFANVSHEFRTPLTLILGPLSQVINKIKTEEEINRLNIVQRNGYRLLRMVDQLLNLETFRVKSITQKSPQAIGKITQLLTDAFSDLANEKQISISFDSKVDINFEFTPDAYEKILLNLLSNAVKYSKSGDSITVTTRRTSDGEFELTVSDTGIGIPEDKLDSIFERYNRVLDENSEQVTGAGIGLALVKELVEAHGGKIEIESHLGEGTSIKVKLPIIGEVGSVELDSHANDEIVAMELMSISAQENSENANQQNQIEEESVKPSVLVIEDNPDMRHYITSSISDDYQVLTANDGEAGLKLAVEEVPDLIISDIMMPKMDGYQTANAIRNNEVTSHIPIILLTARGDRESRLKGWYERADEYLTKPFDVEELKIRLKNLLEIRDILKKRFAETAFEPTQKVAIEDKEDVEANKSAQQLEFLNHLNECLESIYTDTELTIPQIAKAIAMSERQFFRKLKSIVDMSPVEYLRRYRLEKSKQYLKEGKSAGYAAFEVGFASQSYYGRCFKAQFGMSPKEYKNQFN